MEKILFKSHIIESAEENSHEIIDIAQKRGILIPSSHLGFFKTVYAKIEEPNLNNIRLSAEAVYKALPGLVGSQVNFEHLGAGFLCGTILDAWINELDEIEVVYSFFKSIYPEQYEKSIELAKQGKLAVSFELLSEKETQEILNDGTIRLHDIDFQGMGHLMENPPACPDAKIYEFASLCKDRLNTIEDKTLVCASVIEETCNKILHESGKWQTQYINTLPNSSFAVIEPAYLNGDTKDKNARHLPFKDENGKVDLPHYRNALARVEQIKPITDSISQEDLIKKAKEELEKYRHLLDENHEQGGQITVTEEQLKLISDLRAEFGDFAEDISDEDLLNETVVAGIRLEISEKAKEATSLPQTEEAMKQITQVQEETILLTDKTGEEKIVTTIVKTITDYENENLVLQQTVASLENLLKQKEIEIQEIQKNASIIAERKIELKSNLFVKDFSNEDYLNEEKIQKAIQDQKLADLLEARKLALKENEFAQDFSDSDYLDDVKVELVVTKKKNAELEAQINKEKEAITASIEKENEMSTGASDNIDSEFSYDDVMASIRKESREKRISQKVYKRK